MSFDGAKLSANSEFMRAIAPSNTDNDLGLDPDDLVSNPALASAQPSDQTDAPLPPPQIDPIPTASDDGTGVVAGPTGPSPENLPDLELSDVDVGSQDIDLGEVVRETFSGGDEVDLVVDIRNTGSGDAGSSDAAVFLVIDGEPVRMDTNSTRSLDAGETDTNENLAFTIPNDLPAGRYTVFVTSDFRDEIEESDEDNNGMLFFIDVDGPAGEPDLEISEVEVGSDTIRLGEVIDEVFSPGDTFEAFADVRNRGDGDAASSSSGIFLFFDGNFNLMDSNSTRALDAGEVDTNERLDFEIPTKLSPGTYEVFIAADNENEISESDENNNITGFFITVQDDFADEVGDNDSVNGIGSLRAGSSVSGVISGPDNNEEDAFGDRDVFEINLEAGNTYTFRLDGDSDLDNGLFSIRAGNNFNNRLATSEEGSSPELTFTAPNSGTFYVRVGTGRAGQTGEYTLQVSDGEPPQSDDDFADEPGDNDSRNGIGSLSPGSSISGEIGAADANDNQFGDKDVFRITLTGGQRYTFTLEGDSDLRDGLFTIRDGDDFDDRLVESVQGRTSELDFTAPSSGDYFIRVGTGEEGQTGNYTLRASSGETPPPPDGADLRIINASLDETSAEQGELVTVRWEIENIGNRSIGATNVAIRVRDVSDGTFLINPANGTEVFASQSTDNLDPGQVDRNESVSFVLPSTIATGSYQVEILALPGNQTDIDVGNNFRRLALNVTNDGTPPTNPQSNDDFADEPDDFNNVNGVGVLAMGSSISGEIGPADADDGRYGDKDVFLVSLEEGQTYRIELTAEELPLGIFTVRDPSDFSNVLQVSRIGRSVVSEFTADESGNFWIRVGTGGEPGEQGGYSLAIDNITIAQSDDPSAPPPPADDYPDFPGDDSATSGIPTLSVGRSIGGAIEVAGDKDVIAVELVEGRRYQFSLENEAAGGFGALPSVYMTIRDPDNFNDVDARRGGGSQSTITFDAQESGTFFVRVGSGAAGENGGYRLSVVNLGSTPPASDTGVGDPALDVVDEAFEQFVELLRLSVLNFTDSSTWEGLLAVVIKMDDVEFERFARKIVDLKAAKIFSLLDAADVGIEVLFAVNSAPPGQGAREGFAQLVESAAGAAAGIVGSYVGRAVGGFVGGLFSGGTAGVVGFWAGAALGGILFKDILYTEELQDQVRQFGYGLYDSTLASFGSIQAERAENLVEEGAFALDQAQIVQFDEQWFLETYPDALAALQNGTAGSAYAHFITTGIDLGYQPNEAQTITREDLATALTDNNPLALGNSAALTLKLGDFAGDGLSANERQVGDLINGARGQGAALDLDAGLSAIASRKATDLIANFTDDAITTALSETDSTWAQGWSNGNQLTQQFRSQIEDLLGVEADANRIALFVVASQSGNPADILGELQSQSDFAAAMSNGGFDTIGLSEFGGLWVVVFAEREAGYEVSEPGQDTLGQTSLFGGNENDQLFSGHRSAQLYGLDGDDNLVGGRQVDLLTGGLGDDALDGGSNVDTAIVSGSSADYTVTQTSTGVFSVVGPDGTDTLTAVEFLEFDDRMMRLLPGSGVSVTFEGVDPAAYQSAMQGIRDFDGNDLGGDGTWLWIGASDINGDGDQDQILVNRAIGRFATVGTAEDGLVYFDDHSWAGETRVAGIYIDPLVADGSVVAGSDFDSQRRFQNDLEIENIGRVLGADDYDGDGIQEVYFALTDGTAFLRALMHADGNIRYANYQSEEQVLEYLNANGFGEETYGDWFEDDDTGVIAPNASDATAAKDSTIVPLSLAPQSPETELLAEMYG